MAESIAADHPVRAQGDAPAEGGRFFAERDQPFKVEILDDLGKPPTSSGPAGSRGVDRTSTATFIDLCRGPHVESTGKIGPFKLLSRSPAPTGAATRSGRCCSASTARPGRRRRSWTSSCGGARRPRSATTASLGVQLDLFSFHDVAPGRGLLASQGLDALPHAARRDARDPGASAATRRSTRRRWSTRSCGSSRVTGTSTATTCSWSRRTTQTTASSR